MISRRRLIETGIGGSMLLAFGGCATRRATTLAEPFEDSGYAYRALTLGDREMFAALAVPVLGNALPDARAARNAAIVQVVRGVDIAIDGLTPGVQAQLQQLFGLLEFPLTRSVLGGLWNAWGDASPEEIATFLNGWRFSSVALFRSGYQALHQLVNASWYGNDASWARIGYPGPPNVA